MGWNWEYFTPPEVLSPIGLEVYHVEKLCLVRPELINLLTKLRQLIDRPIIINHGDLNYRGFRTAEENRKVGGAEFSQHLYGCAADITIPGFTPSEVARYAEKAGFSGIGIYPSQGFTHVDVRYSITGEITRWHQN